MVQLEAADRICAAVGSRECGAITASINYYAKPKKLFRVNRGSFMPAPNVDSAVISLERYEQPPYKVDNEPLFLRGDKAGFRSAQKTACKSVSAYFKIPKAVLAEKDDRRRYTGYRKSRTAYNG